MKLIFKSYSAPGYQILIPHWQWNILEEALQKYMQDSPKNFFLAKPMVALLEMNEKPALHELKQLKELCQKYGLHLTAVIHPLLSASEAHSCQLALLKNESLALGEPVALPTPSPASGESLLIQETIRLGQRIQAPGDLTIIGNVNIGAELWAQGHIYVLGIMRGRAHAGMNGRRESIIYCQAMEAESLAIAGQQQRQEDWAWRGRIPHCLVQLQADNRLNIRRLESMALPKINKIR